MAIDALLSRLRKVRRTAGDSWTACCPAHQDSSPSLSISMGTNGNVLVHCHAGCQTQAILDAVSLDWRDLFNESRYDPHEFRAHRSAHDVLDVIGVEITAVQLILAECLEQGGLDATTWQRLCDHAATIQNARDSIK